jgi:hypothetical protein
LFVGRYPILKAIGRNGEPFLEGALADSRLRVGLSAVANVRIIDGRSLPHGSAAARLRALRSFASLDSIALHVETSA